MTENRYACSKCRIIYAVAVRGQAKCPLCDANRRILELQSAMTALRNQLEMATDTAVSLRSVVDVQLAMRQALDVTDTRDLTFLKSLLYRYRDDRTSISMRVLHGPARRAGGPATVTGFLAIPRRGDPEAHACSSVGGVALAGYFDEVTRSMSSAEALATLVRALHTCLAGAG